ncbi:MAG: hypothetical protein OEV55_02565 [candidate division Zixibacteria bacterium]|nr:hypothetical protein [candidate division Zixibacteria bacterium]
MSYKKRISVFLFSFLLIFLCSKLIIAQHFVMMSDQQRIELALDMVRKGIQQQDTLKISMVSAPSLFVKQKRFQVNGVLTKELQNVFNNSSKRKLSLQKPSFKQINPLSSSNFWDFDIVNLKIKIAGDSAVVDCELVLWGAEPEPESKGPGRRITERFYFKSPPRTQSVSPPAGEGGTFNNIGKNQNRSWQLVGFDNLLDFLKVEVKAIDLSGSKIKKEGK